MATTRVLSSVWEAMDLYFQEIPQGDLALDPRNTADKQLQDMAEAVIAGRPQDIRLDTLVEPNETFKTRSMDTHLDFNRFIDILRRHNQLEPTLQNPAYNEATDRNHPLHQFIRERAVRSSPSTRAEADAQAKLLEENRERGGRAKAHLDRAKAPAPGPEHRYLDIKLSDRYPGPKKPFGQVHGSVAANDRRLEVYVTSGSRNTGADAVVAAIVDVPHFREIGAAAIGMYSFLTVKKSMPHERKTLDIALWHAELEWEKVLRLHQSLGQKLDESRQETLSSPDWRSLTVRPPPINGRLFSTQCTWVNNDPETHKVEVRLRGIKANVPALVKDLAEKYLKEDKTGKTSGKDTHAIVTGPRYNGKKTVGMGPNRAGLEAFRTRLDRYLYYLIATLDYPMKAATIQVAWRAIAYDQYPLEHIELFDDPEYMVRVTYYHVATSSKKWADPDTPEYAGRYYFEVHGLQGTFYCPTYADVPPPAMSRPVPQGLGVYFSENIEAALKGKSADSIVDGISVSSHTRLQQCIRFIIVSLYELKADIKAMRIALYKFTRRITFSSRNALGAFRSRCPFIIDGVNSAVYLNQKFSFGSVVDEFPLTLNKRLFTGICLGKLSRDERAVVLGELNDAFRTYDSFMAALTFATMFVDSWKEVGMEEDDTAIFEVLQQWCDHDDLDSSHTCKKCGDILRCDEVAREIEEDIICTTCFGSDHVTDNQEVSLLSIAFRKLSLIM